MTQSCDVRSGHDSYVTGSFHEGDNAAFGAVSYWWGLCPRLAGWGVDAWEVQGPCCRGVGVLYLG